MDTYHIGKESLFWPLAANLAEIYTAALAQGMVSAAQFAAIMQMERSKAKAYSALPDSNTAHARDPILIELEMLMKETFFLSSFRYQPLEEPDYIRVLILEPGGPSDPLRGTNRHQKYSRVCYEAVSYTWGDDSTPCSIMLDGCRMSLTRSLFNALVRLRLRDRPRILWADGVCINQADNKEKSVQVGLMPRIFAQASKVFVYLGVQEHGSDCIPSLVNILQRAGIKKFTNHSLLYKAFQSNDIPPRNDKIWVALLMFLRRPWFLRIWVIQEIVLAREVRFLCGSWNLNWQKLVDLANHAEVMLHHALPGRSSDLLDDAAQAAASLGLMLGLRLTRSAVSSRLEDLREGIESYDDTACNQAAEPAVEHASYRQYVISACQRHPELYEYIEDVALGLPDEILPARTPIILLLGMFVRNQATWPQDRLYALVGISADINLSEFPPNYNETEEQTNLRFGRILVQKGQGMDVLYHATKRAWQHTNTSFPSWAPDWTRMRARWDHWLKLGWAYHGGFDKKFASPSSVLLADNNASVLRAKGFCLDPCCGTIVEFTDYETLIQNRKTYDTVSDLKRFFIQIDHVFNGDSYFTGESWSEVACRTLVANHVPKMFKDVPLEALLTEFDGAKRLFIDRLERAGGKNKLIYEIIETMLGNSVCKTLSGYVGVVSEATVLMDEIWLFEGSDLPFVLRPIRALPGYYRFLGGCYMHGLMAGKAWERPYKLSEIFLV